MQLKRLTAATCIGGMGGVVRGRSDPTVAYMAGDWHCKPTAYRSGATEHQRHRLYRVSPGDRLATSVKKAAKAALRAFVAPVNGDNLESDL